MIRVFATVFLTIVYATGADARCVAKKTIVYSNGMINDRIDAKTSLMEIQKRAQKLKNKGDDLTYYLAYNKNENLFSQAIESFAQKNADTWDLFWDFFATWSASPRWLIEFSTDSQDAIDDASYVLDEDLRQHIDLYQNLVNEQRSVTIVAHSQGNFYANTAFDRVGSPMIKILGVAAPTSTIKGSGDYVTSDEDWIINGVRFFYPLTLSANVHNNGDDGIAGHPFVDSYLLGPKTGPLITKHLANHLSSRPTVCE